MPSFINLVQTPDAEDFMQRSRIPTGRKVMLGDRERFQGLSSFNAISYAHNAIKEGAEKIEALTSDKTRNEPEKHAAARQVAEHVKNVLRQSKTTIDREASQFDRETDEILAARFNPSNYSQYSLSETVRWIREQAKKETGLLEIKKQAGLNSRVATVLYDLDDILLDLTPEVHTGFIEASISKLAPEAANKIAMSGQLRKLSANYAKAITGVDNSYYKSEVANQVDTRVEV